MNKQKMITQISKLKVENNKLQKQLKLSKEKYNKLFNNLDLGIAIYELDEENNFIFKDINPAGEKIDKVNKDIIIGQRVSDIFPKSKEFGFLSALQKAWKTGEEVAFENKEYYDYRISGIRNNSIFKLSNGDLISIFKDITDRKKLEKRIRFLSYYDSLTGLYNRNYYDENIEYLNSDDNLPLSLILGDVNGLKLVNDTFGHHTGDELLIVVANIIKQACRKDDIIIRWGGDEFIIILPRTREDEAKKVIQRINKLCQENALEPIKPSIALGVAVKTTLKKNFNEIFTKAEDRMYRKKLIESKAIKHNIISTLENTLQNKIFENEAHIRRFQKIILFIETGFNLSGEDLDALITCAALHDIGKIAIPDKILLKRKPLNQDEWSMIEKHPEIGYRIAKSSPYISDIAEYILTHHEYWDGNGYPQGLKGKETPYISRLIALIDAYDAMTNKTAYQEAIPHHEALKEIKACAGSQFDPNLAEKFISLMADFQSKKDRA